MNLINKIKKILSWIFSSKRRILVSILIVLVIGFFIVRSMFFNGSKITYQTSSVLKDTLVVSLSESGSVAVANRMPISTQASGLVSQVYVSNGDTVEKGQKIADITLDSAGVQKQASAYASYLSAQSSLNKANADMFSTQSTMYSTWDKYTAIAQNSTYQNSDGSPNTSNRALPEFTTSQDNWLAAEANYKNQQTVVFQAQAALTSAWSSYQESSSEIVAPVAGIISDLTIAPGMQLSSGSSSSSSSSSNSNTNSSTNVASIKVDGKPVITINLSEADVVKVHANQKATVTFDALGDLTFTGRVLGINTMGSVSSGVTSYPAL